MAGLGDDRAPRDSLPATTREKQLRAKKNSYTSGSAQKNVCAT